MVGTKIGRYDAEEFDFSAKRTRESILRSLSLLQLGLLFVKKKYLLLFFSLLLKKKKKKKKKITLILFNAMTLNLGT